MQTSHQVYSRVIPRIMHTTHSWVHSNVEVFSCCKMGRQRVQARPQLLVQSLTRISFPSPQLLAAASLFEHLVVSVSVHISLDLSGLKPLLPALFVSVCQKSVPLATQSQALQINSGLQHPPAKHVACSCLASQTGLADRPPYFAALHGTRVAGPCLQHTHTHTQAVLRLNVPD